MIFEGYQLVEKIHEGPSCQVWRGFNFDLELPVALKIFLPDAVAEESRYIWGSLFHNEADILCRLNHPAIVRFYHLLHSYSGEAAIIMEWVEGSSLADLPTLSATQAGMVAVKVLAALNHLHRPFSIGDRHFNTISHGDIKPANILVAEDGVRLIDFGFSCPDLTTEQKGILGTPYYCRPDRKVGRPTAWLDDSYALALTLAESCGLGRDDLPLAAKDDPVFAVFADLFSATPPSPSEAIQRLEAILGEQSYGPALKALSKSPKRGAAPKKQPMETLS